MHDTTYLAMTC